MPVFPLRSPDDDAPTHEPRTSRPAFCLSSHPHPAVGTRARALVSALVVALLTAGCGSSKSPDAPAASAQRAGSGGSSKLQGRAAEEPAMQPFTPATATGLRALREQDLQLVRFQLNGEKVELPPATPITLRLGDVGRVAGKSTVNRYFGSYQFNQNGTVQWPNAALGMSRMAGPPEDMRLEALFMQGLTSTTRLNMSPEGIRFENDDGTTLLEFLR